MSQECPSCTSTRLASALAFAILTARAAIRSASVGVNNSRETPGAIGDDSDAKPFLPSTSIPSTYRFNDNFSPLSDNSNVGVARSQRPGCIQTTRSCGLSRVTSSICSAIIDLLTRFELDQ